jgi:hypothetical protein
MSDNGKTAAPKGLEGVVAAKTRLSDVRGDIGQLVYCGYDINELAGNATYEEVVHLLYYNHLPNRKELAEFKETLAGFRELPKGVIDTITRLPKNAPPMHVLRTIVSLLGCYDTTAEDVSMDYQRRKALRSGLDPTRDGLLRHHDDGAAPGHRSARVMSSAVRTVPTTVPVTLERPTRGSYATGTSRTRHLAAAARSTISSGHPNRRSAIPSWSSGTRRAARIGPRSRSDRPVRRRTSAATIRLATRACQGQARRLVGSREPSTRSASPSATGDATRTRS